MRGMTREAFFRWLEIPADQREKRVDLWGKPRVRVPAGSAVIEQPKYER